MKISIALCTFNGAQYLASQLESIAAQTRPPDELIVCDDQSSDHTREITRSFAASAGFAVHQYVNDDQLGVRKNFDKAISLCAGDLIALCDQDDIWHPEKLRLSEAEFLSSSEVGLVFTNAELVDDRLRAEDRSLWQAIGFDARRKKRFAEGRTLEVLLGMNVVTGATMIFKAEYRDLVLPIPAEGLYHDGWIALIVASVAQLSFIDRPLIKYRQHRAQVVGAPLTRKAHDTTAVRKPGPQYYLEQAARFQLAYKRLAASPKALNNANALSMFQEKIVHLRARAAMPSKRLSRVPLVMKETLNRHYRQYSRGWLSAAKDLLA